MQRITHTDAATHAPGNLPRAAGVLAPDNLLVGTGVALALAVLLVDVFTPQGVAEGMLYSFVVLLSARPRKRHLIVGFAVLSTLLIVAGFAISPAGSNLSISLTNRCLEVALVWMIAGLSLRRLHVERERDLAQRERGEAQAHIEVLHGLLPICAWCKKIRGTDGSWVKLESYISQHSDANFTHSICPECRQTVVRENREANQSDSSAPSI
jgi:hypothetical protein